MIGAAFTSSLRAFAPDTAAGRRLGAMAIVDAIGTGLYLAASTLFFTRVVGLSGHQLGFGLLLAGVVSLMATIPIGALADKWGARSVLIALNLWRAVGFAAFALVQDFTGFLIVVCLLGVADKAASPVLQMLVAHAMEDKQRVRAMAVIRAMRNIGFTIGAALAGVVLALDTRPAYLFVLLGNAASFVLVALVVAAVPVRAAPAPARRRQSLAKALSDLPYLILAVLNAGLATHMTLLAVGMPLWLSEHTEAPRAMISAFVVVNAVLAILFQVRASRGADTATGAARAQFWAGVALASCCLFFALSGDLPLAGAEIALLLAALALTAGELLQSAGGWGLSYHLANSERQGASLALFSLGLSVQQIVAPLLIAGPVIGGGRLGWTLLAAGLFACGAGSVAVTRWANERRAAPQLNMGETIS
jgi:MFS family permease